jgi:hypothetical protein
MDELKKVENVNARLCVIANAEHRNTRIAGNAAIFSFFRGRTEELDESIARLEKYGSQTENTDGRD